MSDPNMERVTVVLSREELAIILRLLGVNEMPGYDPSWLKAAPDGSLPADTRRALEVATNGLIARGFLTDTSTGQEAQITMPAPLIAMVAACAFGEYSVLLAVRDARQRSQAFLHELQGLGVIHTAPSDGLHQFDALNGRAGVLQILETILGLDNQPALGISPATIDAGALERVSDTALRGNAPEAEQLLAQAGVPAPVAHPFAGALSNARALGSVTVAGSKSPESETIGVVTSPSACFLLTRATPQVPQLTVQSVAAQLVRDWLTAHVG
jgi:hypothetical protein